MGKPVLGLPGIPQLLLYSFDLFIGPLIRRLTGINERMEFKKTIIAVMGKSIASAAGREDHIRVYIEPELPESIQMTGARSALELHTMRKTILLVSCSVCVSQGHGQGKSSHG